MGNKAAAYTAEGPASIVAVEQAEARPLLSDPLALRILPGWLRPVVAVLRWGPLRRPLIRQIERRAPGTWASLLCRKRYIDERLRAAVTGAGIDAVVVLGAGLDTCAYRSPELSGMPVYEVDQPINIRRRQARLRAVFGRVPDSVTLVPTDFETQGLAETLTAAGYDIASRATFFVWEGVTPYLTEDAARRTFAALAEAAAGSRMIFTYIRQDFLDGVDLHGSEAIYQAYVVRQGMWHFGLAPERVADFLAEYSWRSVEQMGRAEYLDRYVRPSGRRLQVMEIERAVYAEKAPSRTAGRLAQQ